MSDNRYTIRLKEHQKEWVDRNRDAAEQIRQFIDSQILSADHVDLFEVLRIMQTNRNKILAVKEEWLFKRVSEVCHDSDVFHLTEPGYSRFPLKLPDIDHKEKVETKSPFPPYPMVKTWRKIEFTQLQPAQAYIDRCRQIFNGFLTEMQRLEAYNRELEGKLCQTNTIVSDSLTRKQPSLENGLVASFSSLSPLPMLSLSEQRFLV